MSRKRRYMTATDTATIRKRAAEGWTAREIAGELGVHSATVSAHARREGIQIRRAYPVKYQWTDEMESYLRAVYPHALTADIAQEMGLSTSAVATRAAVLKLRKSRGIKAGWKLPKWNGEVALQSPKARKNYVPVGTVRYAPERDCLVRKYTDDPAVFAESRWAPVHTLLWESINGPVPAGHICVFRPGMRTLVEEEITIDRLEVITRAENMIRNSVHTRYPEDVAKAIVLRGIVDREIRKWEKRLNEHHG